MSCRTRVIFKSHNFLLFQVVEFYFRLMKNADYDVKEKSEIEIPASFEGSGVADDESDESAGLPVVDENYDPSEGSAEF